MIFGVKHIDLIIIMIKNIYLSNQLFQIIFENHLIIITGNIILWIQKNKLSNYFVFFVCCFFNHVFYFHAVYVLQTHKCFYWSCVLFYSCRLQHMFVQDGLYKTIREKKIKERNHEFVRSLFDFSFCILS